jgi:hypothetical protein
MNEFDSHLLEAGAIRLRPWTHQVVDPDQVNALQSLQKAFSEGASNKPTYSRDENLHSA